MTTNVRNPLGETQFENLKEALEREAEAAAKVADVLASARECVKRLDAPGLRRVMSEASAAFDALTRAAAMRNSIVVREAGARGLERETTLGGLLEKLGKAGESLRAPATGLMGELQRVRKEMRAQGLIARFGSAMVANILQIYKMSNVNPAYGANGQCSAAYTRAARTA